MTIINENYKKSNYIDVHLTSYAEPIQNFTDELLDEISIIKPIQSRRRSREALKKTLLNLIHAYYNSGCIRYSRSKNDYSLHRCYGRLWFKYDRLIPIIDGLIELDYVESLNGCWDKVKRHGYQSKIWASSKFIEKLDHHLDGGTIIFIDREPPEQLIVLKNNEKRLIQSPATKAAFKKRSSLAKYNRFINEQFITVELTEEVFAENRFWAEILLQGLLNGKYTLNSLTLNKEILPEIKSQLDSEMRSSAVSGKFISPSFSTSTPNTLSSTSTSTLSTLSSTLTSHIELLIRLSSTQEKRRRPLIDEPLMIQNEQLLDYLLNWMIFFNKDIKGLQNMRDRKRILQTQRSLGDIGIEHFSFRLKYEYLYRVFNRGNKKFERGGRFYGAAHIDIPKHMRGFIHINGEPTVELDYDALHPTMLYNLRGHDLPEYPYDIIKGPEDKKIKKKALLTAINATSDKLAIKAIRKELVDMGIKGPILKDVALEDLFARVKEAHPLIADDIGKDKGVYLQSIDSKIADAIMTNLMAENIPALPVHDSFIVPASCEEKLREQMVEQYQKVMGFTPGISKKEKRYRPKK